jgi:hypothetical protein
MRDCNASTVPTPHDEHGKTQARNWIPGYAMGRSDKPEIEHTPTIALHDSLATVLWMNF